MGVKKYAGEVIKEGKRVRWPKKEHFFPVLLSTIIICVFVALVLTLEDWAAGSLIAQLKSLFSGLKKTTSETSEAAIALFRSLF